MGSELLLLRFDIYIRDARTKTNNNSEFKTGSVLKATDT